MNGISTSRISTPGLKEYVLTLLTFPAWLGFTSFGWPVYVGSLFLVSTLQGGVICGVFSDSIEILQFLREIGLLSVDPSQYHEHLGARPRERGMNTSFDGYVASPTDTAAPLYPFDRERMK